jgi:dihydroneopterin aldolase
MHYTLNDLALSTIIGIHDYERATPQELLFSLKAQLANPILEELESQLILIIKAYCQTHKPLLLEKMAYDLGQQILNKITAIKSLSLQIKKPKALLAADYSYVRILLESPKCLHLELMHTKCHKS